MFDSKLLGKLRILYVEDDQKIRDSLVLLFEKLFQEVLVAVDGEDGHNKFQEEFENDRIIDVIVSDITMPNMNGIEMLKLIKKIDTKVPFILTTGHSDVHYFKEAIKLNVTHYAVKPINIKDVVVHIQEICEVKFQERAIQKKQQELEEYLEAIDQVALISKTDPSGIITYANETFCEVSGYTKEELIGKSHNIIRHPEVPTRTYKELWETIKSGKIWKNKLINRSKNGESYYVNSTIIPIFDKYEDEIIEYISIRFLTTQEEEERRKFKKQVIKNMGNIKKDFHDLQKENDELKEKLKLYAHVDLIQKQLENEKRRNEKFLGQINHYEQEMEKIKSKSDKLISESKERIGKIEKEKKDYKDKNDIFVEKIEQLESLVKQKEEMIHKKEVSLVAKSKKIEDLYDVIDFREEQLSKAGIDLEHNK